MSDELSALVRATAHEETTSAEREFPYSEATLGRFVRDVRRRRAAGGAMLAVAGVLVIGGAVFGVDRLSQAAPPPAIPVGDPTPSVTSSPTPDRTPTPGPTSTPTSHVTTPPTDAETAPPPAPEETAPPPPVEAPAVPPGAVTSVDAGMGGGSGEVVVAWETIADATGYRVYRSDAPDGPFVRSGSVDVATGVTTIEFGGSYEYIDIWPPSSHSFEYIEVTTGGPTWFRVTAYNAGGEGQASVTVCGIQVGYPDC